MMSIQEAKWWKEGVVYQIYPRSFNDSDGDGIGDLKGITEKVDYLANLGVTIIWLSPVYKSPNADNGYDICDYQDIMDEFGTLDDWQEMIDAMHARGIRLVMDLVVNHSSDEHQWFVESRKSKNNPYRDYYIWRPAKYDDQGNRKEPNNWAGWFGGSAWQWDELTEEYYLKLFTPKQPDLNWENPKLRQEVYDMMRWWLDRGIDGFRMDVINFIAKDPSFPDADIYDAEDQYQPGRPHFINRPEMFAYLQEMKCEVLNHYDVMTVGETPFVYEELGLKMTHQDTGVMSMLFQFDHMEVDSIPGEPTRRGMQPWKLSEFKQILTNWQKGLADGGWNSNYLTNHDMPRAVSRFGDDTNFRYESATLLATLTFTLQGTPYIYQGEEFGMTNVTFDSIEDYRDVETFEHYNYLIDKDRSVSEVMAITNARSRDNARTPMQWSNDMQGGFTTGTPWIKVNPNYTKINAASDMAGEKSIYRFYQHLIKFRKNSTACLYGTYEILLPKDESVYAFTRTLEQEQLLIVLNFKGKDISIELPNELAVSTDIHGFGNYLDSNKSEGSLLVLRPFEAVIYQLS